MTLLRKLLLSKSPSLLLSATFFLGATFCSAIVEAQEKKSETLAEVRGSIDHLNDFSKSNIEFSEIKTSLFERVVPPQPPVPANWSEMNAEDRTSWWTTFQSSDQGKTFFADRDRLIKEAGVFEVKYEDDGKFVVFDVPAGIYGMQGRIDKDIEGIVHAFEVFGKIVVEKDVEVVQLQPMPIEVTPLFKPGQPAPELAVQGSDESTIGFDADRLKGKYVFLNFWSSADPDNGYQKHIQDMYSQLKKTSGVELLSIAVDSDSKKASEAIEKNKFNGLHAFTDGLDHKAVTSYGVRSTPSGWLISPDGKIAMTQHEFYQAIKVKPSVAEVISDRIEGKDKPTLADAGNKPDIAKVVGDANKSNIQKLLNLMTLYQKRTNKAVESEKELREWLQTADTIAQNLVFMNIEIDKFDEYLVSERDGEKFDVRWGRFQERGGASEPFVFERVGVDGKRMVSWTSGGGVKEVDQEEYEKLSKGLFEQSGN